MQALCGVVFPTKGNRNTMEHNTLQGVIFDLDGTLLDSGSMWRQVDKKIMDYYGKEMPGCCGYEIPEHILDLIDLERYGRYCGEETLSEYIAQATALPRLFR